MNFSEIDKDIPVPLYYQISQQIREQILRGDLSPGDQLPTEKELQEQFDVSRATIRRAISDLVYAGLLERKRALGTIVARGKVEGTLYGFGSFTTEIMQRGLTPKSRILELGIEHAVSPISGFLGVDDGEPVMTLDRMRIVDDVPVAVESVYVPSRLVPGIQRSDFSEDGKRQSTYFVFEDQFGLRLFRAEDTIEAVALEPEEARLLELAKGYPVLLRTRVAFTTDDVPAVYSSGVYAIKLLLSLESIDRESSLPQR
jgi:GntR family transcriptional regulator